MFTFGKALEAELDRAGNPGRGKNKKSQAQIAMAQQLVLDRWLGRRRFAEPPQQPRERR